ncbi:MAG: hypothetical protein ACE5KA_05885 [Nitrososphaerales archaeon]
MIAIIGLVTMVSASLSKMAGQIGPVYDPLFYDVMVYIFGVMVFAVFLLGVISFWLRRKGLGGTAQEKWVEELEKHYEREGVGLLPEESRK